MTTVSKGSRVKLVFSDGSTLEWQAMEDLSLSRALDMIGRLSKLDPGYAKDEDRA